MEREGSRKGAARRDSIFAPVTQAGGMDEFSKTMIAAAV
jgi:hypothetical protein